LRDGCQGRDTRPDGESRRRRIGLLHSQVDRRIDVGPWASVIQQCGRAVLLGLAAVAPDVLAVAPVRCGSDSDGDIPSDRDCVVTDGTGSEATESRSGGSGSQRPLREVGFHYVWLHGDAPAGDATVLRCPRYCRGEWAIFAVTGKIERLRT